MKKTFLAAGVFIFLLLFLSACSLTGTRVREKGPVLDYRKGSDGIVISFAEGTPPKRVYEGSKFNVIVKVWNKGAFDNPQGTLHLQGYDPTAIIFDANIKEIPKIQGSSQYLPGGGYDTVVFNADSTKVLAGDYYKPTLMVSNCFRYETIATPSVCIVPDPSALIKNKVCEPKTITLSNQGAPIAVTRVDEEVMYDAVNFIITIQNVGKGNVVNLEKFSSCPNLKYSDLDEVEIDVRIANLGPAQCSSGNKVKLVDGRGTVICRFNAIGVRGDDLNSYVTPLQITLKYGYNTNIKQEIEIVRIPGTKPENTYAPIDTNYYDYR
ncbi:MAG: hypothetical protein QXK37_04750 [Candidatus Woesearchaeota archaeon]